MRYVRKKWRGQDGLNFILGTSKPFRQMCNIIIYICRYIFLRHECSLNIEGGLKGQMDQVWGCSNRLGRAITVDMGIIKRWTYSLLWMDCISYNWIGFACSPRLQGTLLMLCFPLSNLHLLPWKAKTNIFCRKDCQGRGKKKIHSKISEGCTCQQNRVCMCCKESTF